jgi:hypothetical protein
MVSEKRCLRTLLFILMLWSFDKIFFVQGVYYIFDKEILGGMV